MSAQAKDDLTHELHHVSVPTLLICGKEDALFGVDYQEALLALLPNASLEVMPGLGHSPHWEAPEAVAKLIARWVNSVAAKPLELQE